MKKMTLKQQEANRRNATRSTGPRSTRGKAVSRLNALKHGIFSNEVVVHGIETTESEEDFAELHQRFVKDLRPDGPVEEMLVAQIVTTHWRLRRVLKAESAEIALGVDGEQRQRTSSRAAELEVLRWRTASDPIAYMKESQAGNALIERGLTDALAAVEAAGELTEEIARGFDQLCGGKSNSLSLQVERLRRELSGQTSSESEAQRAKNKEAAVNFLRVKLQEVVKRRTQCAAQEEREANLKQAAGVLPAMSTTEKIVRYESMLLRGLYRAMGQLERLQRRRSESA